MDAGTDLGAIELADIAFAVHVRVTHVAQEKIAVSAA
jgi:hypothetical protein